MDQPIVSFIVDNNSTVVEGIEPGGAIHNIIKKVLRYRPEDAIFRIYNQNKNFNNQHWDGYVNLVCRGKQWCKCPVKKSGIHFPTGLYSKAIQALKDYGIKYQTIDNRPKYEPSFSMEMSKFFEERDYHLETVDKAVIVTRGIIQAATGSGKTPMSALLIKRLGVVPFIFYVPSIDLLKQTQEELSKFLRHNGKKFPIGAIGGGIFDPQDITIMTIQTAVRACGQKYENFDDEDNMDEDTTLDDKRKEIFDIIKGAKGIIADEVQHWAAETCQVISDYSIAARYKYGLSVSPDSVVEMKGIECFQNGFIGTIEDVYMKVREIIQKDKISLQDGYEIVDTCDIHIYSRGWNGQAFVWKRVKKIIRHKTDDGLIAVRYRGQNRIKATRDHSIFRINNQSVVESVTSDSIQNDDVLLYDNGKNWENIGVDNYDIDVWGILYNNYHNVSKLRVGVDLCDMTASEIGVSEAGLYQLKRRGKKSGTSLNIGQYLRCKDKLGNPTKIYTEGANGVFMNPDITFSNLAYLMGFFLGDGWLDGNRISFAVEKNILEDFLKHIESISINVRPKIRDRGVGSVEVKISNAPLACIFRYFFGNQKCYNKRIPPQWIVSASKSDRQKLLEGLLASDGCLMKDNSRNRRETRYTTTSFWLAQDISCLLRSLGVINSLSIREAAPGGNIDCRQIQGKKQSYQVIWSWNDIEHKSDGHKGHPKKHETIDCNEAIVREVSSEVFSGYVYDFEMDGHPSFVANGVLVHNSATPWRDKGDDILIDACFGKPIANISASFLIKKGYLVRPTIHFIKIPHRTLNGMTYASIYKNHIVENTERNNIISKLATRMADDGANILILVRQISHGEMLEDMIPNSVFLHGAHSGKQRKKHIEKVRKEKAFITIATSIFDEGVDIRPLDTLILAGSGKSQTRALQRIGRILRPYTSPNGDVKKTATVIDFDDPYKYLKSHSNKRRAIYATEPEFIIEDLTV